MIKIGFSLWRWLAPKNGQTSSAEIRCKELFAAAQEFQIRELCFWVCVNMIANALSRCEFRTFRKNEEIFEQEYYLWNIEPNPNQNSAAFLHQLVARLYEENEVLIFDPAGKGKALVVADGFQQPENRPDKPHIYRDIMAGDVVYRRDFPENKVLHLILNHVNIRPVLNGLCESHYKLVAAAVKNYQWDRGQHWKVHVNQIAQGADGWAAKFQEMIEAQIKPFLDSNGAVLPEFDGYQYENVGGGGGADTRDIRSLIEDIFDFTARAFLLPAVLVNGAVEGTADANTRFLTNCIDPLCDQLQAEIIRKRYGYEGWRRGDFLRVDSSTIIHFDLFAQAVNIEKLVGSGAYTINDVRRAANQAQINADWANKHYLTLNIAAMNEQARQLEGGETN